MQRIQSLEKQFGKVLKKWTVAFSNKKNTAIPGVGGGGEILFLQLPYYNI